MTGLIEYLLAAMIAITPPGKSTSSRVPVGECGDECAATPVCDPVTEVCSLPEKDDTYARYLAAELYQWVETLPEDFEQQTYTRQEHYLEGLARYYIIARTIEQTADRYSVEGCLEKNQCSQVDEHQELCNAHCKQMPWKGRKNTLAWALFSITRFESDWRQDVQAGVYNGDCRIGRARTPENCRSFGIGQANFGRPHKELEGLLPEDVVGIDAGAVQRSLWLTTIFLSRSYGYCSSRTKDKLWGMMSLYGTGSACESKVLWNRTKFLKRHIYGAKKKLTEQQKEYLSDPYTQAVIEYLSAARDQVVYLPASPIDLVARGIEE